MTTITVFSEPLIEQYGKGFNETQQQREGVSGDAANIAVNARRIGEVFDGNTRSSIKINIFAALGADARGDQIVHFLNQNGISTDHIVRLKDRPTAAYRIHIRDEFDASGHQKRESEYLDREDAAMRSLFDTRHVPDIHARIDALAKETDILVVTGIAASRLRTDEERRELFKLVDKVREHGGKIIVDTQHRPALWNDQPQQVTPVLEALYAKADLAFIADDEIDMLHGTDRCKEPDKVKDIAKKVVRTHHTNVMLKQGKEGGTLIDRTLREFKVPASANNGVVDRNGAGDTLTAGYLATIARGGSDLEGLYVGQRSVPYVLKHAGGILQELPSPDVLNETREKARAGTRIHQAPVSVGINFG